MRKIVIVTAILVFTVCFMTGCRTPDLVVAGADGKPIEGAILMGTSLSISGQTTKTDGNGCAAIPWAVQETKWISVSKPGYETVGNIDVKQKKPIRILLKKK